MTNDHNNSMVIVVVLGTPIVNKSCVKINSTLRCTKLRHLHSTVAPYSEDAEEGAVGTNFCRTNNSITELTCRENFNYLLIISPSPIEYDSQRNALKEKF